MPPLYLLALIVLGQPHLQFAARPALHTVALSKQHVPVHRGDRIVATKNAYFGTVYVGLPEPQAFTVLFDTGSGHFILPSQACKQDSCLKHRRYDKQLSGSAVAIDSDGVEVPSDSTEFDTVDISFGTGQVSGPFVQEVVCFGNGTGTMPNKSKGGDCVGLRVVTAEQMTQDPFQHFDFDGVAGLGLDGLALHKDFSFVGQLEQLGLGGSSYFGVFLAKADSHPSEISFGGHNEQRVSGPLSWVPVAAPQLGYWQVEIRSVRVGGKAIDLCDDGTCRAVLDTGTSMLGVPRQAASTLHWSLARPVPGDADVAGNVDCRDFEGPTITFDLGGVELRLEAEDYSRPAPTTVQNKSNGQKQAFCRASLLPVDMGQPLSSKTFIFGEPVLRRHYTTYDWRQHRIGFALARQPDEPPSSLPATEIQV
uniref:Peptidase A1 domain-containing protein n=1 Tax=Alexandrium catenella TaxID=2925 RepID=A0A7S1WDR6_ALECA|mmetsp:Transcript_51909/g.138998  ORF Transcript_51909/g.138998 Transcript_51909/m.138998 type:complete len:422 (+) Transcript_51909:85-1350(+)|eukprot:CAMPEP_0171163608 /NCGR_PEP_ID=MMETSP0790-20130122/5236_1 /TAXON_ID=2925 /ORGANISM="Alexandrium catenella, Strain OF101" /LENGTH=421 /DNA_ID=CAMNT_0011628329 /DNA_START=83 /DNA_END=1348 /DNA_ORIENTATION=+